MLGVWALSCKRVLNAMYIVTERARGIYILKRYSTQRELRAEINMARAATFVRIIIVN